MKSNVKIAPKSNVQTPVAVSEVKEELPAEASESKTKKEYTSAKDLQAFLETPEELVTLPQVRAKVGVSKNGKTFLRTRHNGCTVEIYEADEGLVFPDGMVVGAVVNATVDIRANDGIETKTAENGAVYKTVFAVNCEIA